MNSLVMNGRPEFSDQSPSLAQLPLDSPWSPPKLDRIQEFRPRSSAGSQLEECHQFWSKDLSELLNSKMQLNNRDGLQHLAGDCDANLRFKTEICRNYKEKGVCIYGELCQFAHGSGELRDVIRHNKYKTKKCQKYWISGYCAYGPRCNFIHNEIEVYMKNKGQAFENPKFGLMGYQRPPMSTVRPFSSNRTNSRNSSVNPWTELSRRPLTSVGDSGADSGSDTAVPLQVSRPPTQQQLSRQLSHQLSQQPVRQLSFQLSQPPATVFPPPDTAADSSFRFAGDIENLLDGSGTEHGKMAAVAAAVCVGCDEDDDYEEDDKWPAVNYL